MAESTPSPTGLKPTLGLTGLTSNAMALIAPGAFLWLTYVMQSQYGKPIAGVSMWFGILVALALCIATAIAYAELSKLYPGAGSSYFFAEQAFLSKKQAFKWARVAKFMVGWASHLYYWVYPGVMVAVTAVVAGYMVGQIWPKTFNAGLPSPLFMILFCVIFAFGVAYIAFRGVTGTTGVNVAINIIQITALLVFSGLAISYRLKHEGGKSNGWALIADADGNNKAYEYQQKSHPDPTSTTDAPKPPILEFDANGQPVLDTTQPNPVAYGGEDPNGYGGVVLGDDPMDTDATPGHVKKQVPTFNSHKNAASVIGPHGFSMVMVQACVAILILVGFESVTSMGEEAKNAKRDIPRAVLLSLAIQGGFCYLIEYFAANYLLHNNYTNQMASASSAPIGDMMQIVGAHFLGGTMGGWWFMMISACTVFLALIGTTLSCLSTGARVTYAMGRDEEIPNHFGMLHGKNLTPHRSIWTLAIISAGIGIFGVILTFTGPGALPDSQVDPVRNINMWYKFGLFNNTQAGGLPQGVLVITLVSNFGTFLLYMMTCITAIVAFREHHTFHGFKHVVVPVFGLLANLLCMLFYIIGPLSIPGMSPIEPRWALAVVGAWGLYGAVFFMMRSKKTGKSMLIKAPPPSATVGA